ncbi:MAG: STAS domain-containing protein [Planctomycetota bacterium]|jgi:anti-anti-sigma factor|nr:STAS domain-containing protein [Planctomycetota bacterium]
MSLSEGNTFSPCCYRMPPYTHLSVEPLGNGCIIRLGVPRIVDDPVTDALRHEVAAAIAAATPPNIIIDLSGVQLVSSAGIAFFRDIYRAATARKGQAVLAGPQTDIRKLMRMVGLDTIFSIHDDVAAAAAAF